MKLVDINGDGKINSDDEVPIGYSSFPDKIFGVSFGGDFKGFDFSVLFQGAANVSTQYSSYNQPFTEAQNGPTYTNQAWSKARYDAGLPIKFPRFNQGYSTSPSNNVTTDQSIVDASYLRLKTAEIGYTLPEKWLKKVGITYFRVYVNGSNLATWCKLFPGLDPESAGSSTINNDPYPVTRTINTGFNVKF